MVSRFPTPICRGSPRQHSEQVSSPTSHHIAYSKQCWFSKSHHMAKLASHTLRCTHKHREFWFRDIGILRTMSIYLPIKMKLISTFSWNHNFVYINQDNCKIETTFLFHLQNERLDFYCSSIIRVHKSAVWSQHLSGNEHGMAFASSGRTLPNGSRPLLSSQREAPMSWLSLALRILMLIL